MIKDSVLIVGAGGSAHLGYPTGIKLMEALKKFDLEKIIYRGWTKDDKPRMGENPVKMKSIFGFRSLVEELNKQSSAKNIDAFLRDNDMHQEAGKLLIAAEILSKEKKTHGSSQGWYNTIFQQLLEYGSTENILNNELAIITFNYDVSLEYYFYEQIIRNPRSSKYATALCERIQTKLIHVYGAVRTGTFQEIHSRYGDFRDDEKFKNTHLFNVAEKSAIKVISGDKHDEISVKPHLIEAKKLLVEAKKIFVLGFGFDVQNVALLGLKELSDKIICCANQDQSTLIQKIIKNSFGSNNCFEPYTDISDAVKTIGLSYLDEKITV